jgi:hypothetical protein
VPQRASRGELEHRETVVAECLTDLIGLHKLSAMVNIFRPTFEDGERPEGFRSRRARIGYELGSELVGASLWEVPPGEAACGPSSGAAMASTTSRGSIFARVEPNRRF